MSVETLYVANCGFFRFWHHLVLRFPGVSVFQTTDLPEVGISKMLTCNLVPHSPTSDLPLLSSGSCMATAHCEAVIPVWVQ